MIKFLKDQVLMKEYGVFSEELMNSVDHHLFKISHTIEDIVMI